MRKSYWENYCQAKDYLSGYKNLEHATISPIGLMFVQEL